MRWEGGKLELLVIHDITEDGHNWPPGDLNRLLRRIIRFRSLARSSSESDGICAYVTWVSLGRIPISRRDLKYFVRSYVKTRRQIRRGE